MRPSNMFRTKKKWTLISLLLMCAIPVFNYGQEKRREHIQEISVPSSNPLELTAVGNMLYFIALNPKKGELLHPGEGYRLFRSDGTAEGTIMIKDIVFDPSVLPLVESKGKVFFVANDKVHGKQLWISDGSIAGTRMVKEILPGKKMSSPSLLGEWKGSVLFKACDLSDASISTSIFGICGLWRSDGTSNGTFKLKDGVSPVIRFLGTPSRVARTDDVLFFVAHDGTESSLWKTDGTTEHTTKVKDTAPATMAVVKNTLFFLTDGKKGREVWKSDGTSAGTILLKSFPAKKNDYPPTMYGRPSAEFDHPPEIREYKNGILFSADDGKSGSELWKADSTGAVVTLVKDTIPGRLGCNPYDLTEFLGNLYFLCDNHENENIQQLWKTDGTERRTLLVKKFNHSCVPFGLTKGKSSLFFIACESKTGSELWKSDGSLSGTVLVKDIWPGPKDSNPFWPTLVGETLFFVADDGVHGRELWKSDGTEKGTMLVKDIASEPYREVIHDPTPLDEQ